MSSTAASAGAELRVICGPTAAGKSALALAVAERTGAVIISADSRQIYRGFDIGTAKPDAAEQARVPHRGIDVVEPTERYSAARFAHDAVGWIDAAARAGRTAVVVGGTGFYVRALVDPLFRSPHLDPARRAGLERALAPFGVAELRRWAAMLDPDRASLGRTQLLRAIETALLTGQRISDLHRSAPAQPRPARYLVVDPGRDVLRARIEARIDRMLAQGWLAEVRSLVASVPLDAPAWNASGYRSMRAHVLGELSLDDARDATIVATRQYAKRQRTWIRHQLPAEQVTTVDPRAADALDRTLQWWEGDHAGIGSGDGERSNIDPGDVPGGEYPA